MASERSNRHFSRQVATRILVVDDEPRLASALAALLRSCGHDVTEAHGGKRACELIDTQPFDLALLDLRMPEIDGFSVMAHLVNQQPDCGTVVISGESSFTAVSRALRRGALDYIRKPFDPEELVATIKGVVDKQLLLRPMKTYRDALRNPKPFIATL